MVGGGGGSGCWFNLINQINRVCLRLSLKHSANTFTFTHTLAHTICITHTLAHTFCTRKAFCQFHTHSAAQQPVSHRHRDALPFCTPCLPAYEGFSIYMLVSMRACVSSHTSRAKMVVVRVYHRRRRRRVCVSNVACFSAPLTHCAEATA